MDEKIIAAASSYEEKYYLDEAYRELPEEILDELHRDIVLLTDEIGGIVTFLVTKEGLVIHAERQLDDLHFDEIYSREVIDAYTKEKGEFLQQLLMYHMVFHTDEGETLKEELLDKMKEED